MKILSLLLAVVLSDIASIPAQVSQPVSSPSGAADSATPYREGERGPHHKVWERFEYEPTMDGKLTPHRRSYEELATGMHYREGDQWLESEETIEILPNNAGAVASKGQHKVIFPPELKSGIIELQTPDGQWLRSRVWGLAYFDASSGESVLLAEVKESEGQLVGDNVVVFPDAFTDFLADVRLTYFRAGFEQDIVIRENPPAPEKFGLDPKSTRLQVLTEFVEAPQPTKLPQQAGDLADESLGFGQSMNIGSGKAFSVDVEGERTGDVPVSKQWERIEGRDFLIEQVLYEKVTGQLQQLPAAGKYKSASLQRRGHGENVLAGLKQLMPKRYAKTAPKPGIKRMARVTPQATPSFVMDYITMNTSLTNQVFKGHTTYYISGNVSLYGTNNTFEGGTSLKYASNVTLTVNTPVTWLADSCRPVVMTSKNDNTVGETISGSTGNPGNYYYAANALYFDGTAANTNLVLRNLRVLNATRAVSINDKAGHLLQNVQFLKCASGLALTNAEVSLRNALMSQVLTNFTGTSATGRVEHLTSDVATWLNRDIGTTLYLTNCLLVGVTNWGTFTSVNNATNSSATGIFQTVGGGEHYLSAGSTYRNAGTTNINADALVYLGKTTTYPPIAYTNITFTSPTTFNPQAQRDTDTPDLGYHYDPLDYSFGGCHANSNITFTAGTAVGWFRTTSGWYHAGHGLRIGDKQIASFEGTVTSPCYWVRLNTVQENDRSVGYGPGGMTSWAGSLANAAEVRARFTRCSMMNYDVWNHFRDDWGWLNVRATDCEFYGNSIGGYAMSLYFTNCLFQRVSLAQVSGDGPCTVAMRNCTMFGGPLQLTPSYPSSYTILDSAFEDVTFSFSGYAANASYATYDYNAYTNASNPFPLGGSHNVPVTNFNWQTSWLGKYYLPSDSPLIDVGSVTAPNIALYHFTTQTNETSTETTSQVDIGYHYVGVDYYGVPLDSDSDGTPDYIEDVNGNGTVDSGETDWAYGTGASDKGLRVIITEPKRSANLP